MDEREYDIMVKCEDCDMFVPIYIQTTMAEADARAYRLAWLHDSTKHKGQDHCVVVYPDGGY